MSATALVYFLLCGIIWYPFGVFLPFICEEFNWSRGAVSAAYTVMMASIDIIGPFAGIFIAKYGSRCAIVLGNFMSAMGFLLLAFHKHIWQLYVGYGLLIGPGVGLGGFIATTTIANNWFDKKRSLALSIVITSGGLGGLLLIPGIMAVIKGIGWRSAYMVLFFVTLLFMVVIPGLVVRNKPEDLGQIPDGEAARNPEKRITFAPPRQIYKTPADFTLSEAVRTRALWLLLGALTAQAFAMSLVVAHQVAFMIDIGITTGVAAAALGLVTGTSIIGRLGIGFLGLRYNMQTLAIVSFALMTIGMALILLIKSLAMVFVYVTVFGIGFGAFVVASTGLFPIYFGRTSYPKILGFIGPFAFIGSAGAPVAGAIYDATGSYFLPFSIGVLILLAGLICIIFARPPSHPSLQIGLR